MTRTAVDGRPDGPAGQNWSSARRNIALAAAWGGCLLCSTIGLFCSLPKLQDEAWAVLRRFPPRSLEQLVATRDVFSQYADRCPARLAAALGAVYVCMQTFAIPGTLSLSLLTGALFGTAAGIVLVSVFNLLGSTSCYCMSWLVGRTLVLWLYPDKLQPFAAEVAKRKASLLNYMIFLRVTPVLPNTAINLLAPLVDVGLVPFALGTVVGCLPNNFVAVSAGDRLNSMTSLSDMLDLRMLLIGCGVGIIALLPLAMPYLSRKPKQL